jgi:hypothetical protein
MPTAEYRAKMDNSQRLLNLSLVSCRFEVHHRPLVRCLLWNASEVFRLPFTNGL